MLTSVIQATGKKYSMTWEYFFHSWENILKVFRLFICLELELELESKFE